MSAISWLLDHGLPVFIPIGHSPDVDLITDLGGGPVRVQVKTSSRFQNRRWGVTVYTRGGNRSWSGLVKRLDPTRYDYLFVQVADGRRWWLPAAAVGGGTAIWLGGPKYAEYEVERGHPLRKTATGARLGDPPAGYPSGQRDQTVNLAAQPSQVRILPPPLA
jgi:PD-(D/E)XK endonuclease